VEPGVKIIELSTGDQGGVAGGENHIEEAMRILANGILIGNS